MFSMIVSGHLIWSYKAGFDKEGYMKVLDVEAWNNGGSSSEITREVMDRGAFHATNAYHCSEAFRFVGTCCKSNITSNTAYRGFGATQTMLMTETVIDQAAHALGKAREELVFKNLLRAGAKTPYGQRVEQCHLEAMWEDLCGKGKLEDRRAAVEAFNATNTRHKMGLAVVPTMYGINFPVAWLNQGRHVTM